MSGNLAREGRQDKVGKRSVADKAVKRELAREGWQAKVGQSTLARGKRRLAT